MEDMKTIGAPEMNVIGAPIRSSKNIVITPDVKYESYAAESGDTSIDDILPAEGAKDTIYRVASWDGTQVDATKSSEYVWDGEDYILLRVLEDSIGDGVFDISAYNASGGTLATYADLAAALGSSGANVPEGVRKGGMSVKYVQSSDNKYIQYRYMGTATTGSPNPFLNTANWQGVDEVPTDGSENLVKSGGVNGAVAAVYNYFPEETGETITPNYSEGAMLKNGTVTGDSTFGHYEPILLPSYCTIILNNGNNVYWSNIAVVYECDSEGNFIRPILTDGNYQSKPAIYKNDSAKDIYVGISTYAHTLKYSIKSPARTQDVFETKESAAADKEDAIKGYILSETFTVRSVTRNADGDVTSTNVTFPDGVLGSLVLTRDANGDVSSVAVVYGTESYTLSITRNADGDVLTTSLSKN